MGVSVCALCVCDTLTGVGGTDHVTRPSHDCQRNGILEGLAEKDGNVPFLVDLPMNTLQVISNALLLRDLQVRKCVLIVH